MRVSIVIPCRNHAHFLREAIASALAQSWPDCEVIVVDDGSTDDTAGVAREHSRVRLLQQSHRGLSAARNAGLRASTGDLLIFLDADDRLLPDAARIAVETFAAHPHAVMVFGRCRLLTPNGLTGQTSPPMRDADVYAQLLRDNHLWTPGVAAFRRGIFQAAGGFDETNDPAGDYDLYLRISRAHAVVSHGMTVAEYRQHGGNMSNDPVRMLEATLAVLRAQKPYMSGSPARKRAFQEAMATWRACYGERVVERFRAAVRRRDHAATARHALHLLRLYPAGVRYHLQKKLTLLLRGPRSRPTAGDASAPPSRPADV